MAEITVTHAIEEPPPPSATVRRVRQCPECGTPTADKWCSDVCFRADEPKYDEED